jgi:hypothetical protein
VSVKNIRDLMCVDRGMTGKMIELLKASNRHDVMKKPDNRDSFHRATIFLPGYCFLL